MQGFSHLEKLLKKMARSLLNKIIGKAMPAKSELFEGCRRFFDLLRRNFMNRFRNLMAVFAFSLLVLGIPAIASAQWRNDRNNDDNYRNDRNNDDNYGGYNNRALQSTIRDLKNRSKRFAREFDRELDNSRINGSDREDRLNDVAKDFAKAADRLDDRYDNGRDLNRSQNEAQRVLDLGLQLDRAISRSRLRNNVGNDWYEIRRDLQTIGNAYNYNYDNRNNRNDDYNNNRNRNRRSNNDWWRNIPFPN